MYINISKIFRSLGILLAIVIMGFGIVRFIFAGNIQLQIASGILALFGLQLLWFLIWLGKSK